MLNPEYVTMWPSEVGTCEVVTSGIFGDGAGKCKLAERTGLGEKGWGMGKNG